MLTQDHRGPDFSAKYGSEPWVHPLLWLNRNFISSAKTWPNYDIWREIDYRTEANVGLCAEDHALIIFVCKKSKIWTSSVDSWFFKKASFVKLKTIVSQIYWENLNRKMWMIIANCLKTFYKKVIVVINQNNIAKVKAILLYRNPHVTLERKNEWRNKN